MSNTTIRFKLRTLTVPSTLQHASAKEEIERIPDYVEVLAESLNGLSLVNFGPDEPNSDNRAYPWLKTYIDGAPIGWYVYYNSAWTKVPLAP